MRQPPGTPPLEVSTPNIASLFDQAFSRAAGEGGNRPSARDWVSALDAATKQLVVCVRHNGHYYPRNLATCPWCSIEAATGVIAFNVDLSGIGSTTPGIQPGQSFDLAALWLQIEAVPDPGIPPLLAVPADLPLTPSPTALEHSTEMRRLTRIMQIALIAGIVTTLLSCVVPNIAPGIVVTLLVLTAIGCYGISFLARQRRHQNPARQEAIRERDTAQARLIDFEQRWKGEAGNTAFHAERAELVRQKEQYKMLAEVRHRKVQDLTNNTRQRQLEQFLDRHRIASASIPNIGPGRKATLQSYNVETAADVTQTALLRVPGFGPTLASNLLVWRSIIEARFVFDPQRAVDPTDVANLDREIANQRALLEQSLRGGLLRLRRTVEQVQAARTALHTAGDQAQRALAQAEANLKVL